MTGKTVYLARTYKRTRYHLHADCRRLTPTTKIREVPVTHGSLDGLRPCKACMGTADLGGVEGETTAKKLSDMDASDVPALE